jgi:hypothetical protein
MPKWLLIGAAATFALIFIFLVLMVVRLLRGEPAETEVAEVPVAELPVVAEEPLEVEESVAFELPQELVDALELFVKNDLLAARGALDELAEMQEQGELPPEACETYYALADSVLLARVAEVGGALGSELRRGREGPLRRVLGTVSRAEGAALSRWPGSEALLDDARRALAAVDEFERAMRGEDPDVMLEQGEALRISWPQFEQSLRARERVATFVEESAEAMVANGQLEEAMRRLERLQSLRPDRRGVINKIGAIERQLRSQERFDTLAASLERVSAARRPSDGLAMLQGVSIPAAERGRFDKLRERLQAQLSELDSNPPAIRLADSQGASEIEFRRDEGFSLTLEISDDYEVVRSELSLRNADGGVTVMPLTLDNGKATVEILPALHGGRDVDLWVTSVDRSGHVGTLGSANQPIEAKRRRWFRR